MNYLSGSFQPGMGWRQVTVAVLTNPASTGNLADGDRIRDYCAARPEVLHIEVQRAEEVHAAVASIVAARPEVLVVNGGDGTVQAVLTHLIELADKGIAVPPVSVVPNGKTNLIAKDLGATGDPLRALDRALELARDGVADNLVNRQLIRLDTGDEKPALGMFLAAGALEEIILFCRHKIYPLGLPNGVAHALTMISGVMSVLTDWTSRFLPPKPSELRVTVGDHPPLQGRFQVLMVTTLRKLVLSGTAPAEREGTLQLLAVERRRSTILRGVLATLTGRLGKTQIPGVHLKMGAQIRIEDERTGVLMDGELFAPTAGKPIILTPTRPLRFLDLSQSVRARAPVRAPRKGIPLATPPLAAGNAFLSDPR